MSVLLTVVVAAALVPASLRWLRVAQREHYLAGSTARFATRWWHSEPRNIALSWAAVLAAFVAFFVEPVALVAAAALTVGPLHLSIRGRTSKLAWTRRLRVVAIATGALDVVVIGIGLAIGFGPAVTALLCSAQPRVIDLALAVLRPFERRASRRWVDKAARRLRQVDPTTVAITGSYGKTTTKGYVRQPGGAIVCCCCKPGELQQHGRAVAHSERAAHSGYRGVRRRDGHIRPRRDRRYVRVGATRHRGHNGDRSGTPRAVRLDRAHCAGQGRDPRNGEDGSCEHRRCWSGVCGRRSRRQRDPLLWRGADGRRLRASRQRVATSTAARRRHDVRRSHQRGLCGGYRRCPRRASRRHRLCSSHTAEHRPPPPNNLHLATASRSSTTRTTPTRPAAPPHYGLWRPSRLASGSSSLPE